MYTISASPAFTLAGSFTSCRCSSTPWYGAPSHQHIASVRVSNSRRKASPKPAGTSPRNRNHAVDHGGPQTCSISTGRNSLATASSWPIGSSHWKIPTSIATWSVYTAGRTNRSSSIRARRVVMSSG